MALKDYYTITKPGIIYGNLFVAAGAFFLAAHWHADTVRFIAMLAGLGLVIACGCVLNNDFDRDIDAVMERTRTRASVTGALSHSALLLYAATLGIAGTAVLYFLVNTQALSAALFGLIAYVVLYTMLAKRGSAWGTIIGSISGAMPPTVGYVAVAGSFDAVSLALFLMLVFWQMPHAYAIALFRLNDYKAAEIPVLPAALGVLRTKIEMLVFVLLFGFASLCLTYLGAAGMIYGITATLASLAWLALSMYGFFAPDTAKWGRRMFIASLIILMLLFALMAIDSVRL